MNWIALKILLGDQSKYLGLVFGIAFATLLIAQQATLFVGIMNRTAGLIRDMRDVDIWVMDKRTDNIDFFEPMIDTAVDIVRGIEGVKWAVPLIKGISFVQSLGGKINQGQVIGLDDTSLVGAPYNLIKGNLNALNLPNSVIIDSVGYHLLWPNQNLYELGYTIDINDYRVTINGIADTTPSFTFLPIIFTTYSNALKYVYGGRKRLSFVLVKATDPSLIRNILYNINTKTPFKALTRDEFQKSTIMYYLLHTGIPVNFAVTVTLGLIVGAVIVGLLLNMFVSDNIKQFASLKAMGLENRKLIKLVLFQALIVFIIGYAIGSGLSALFSIFANNSLTLKGIYMPWYIMLGSGIILIIVVILSSLFSLNRVLKIDPAIVFKG